MTEDGNHGARAATLDKPEFDVLVLGEVLVELTAREPLREAETLRLACSGDALNAAAAAAAAGASVALVTAVGDDELGERILEFVAARGIDTTYARRAPEPNGVYFAGPDGEFVYARRGSAGSTLGPDDVARAPAARIVWSAASRRRCRTSCAAAVDTAVAAAGATSSTTRTSAAGSRRRGRARGAASRGAARRLVTPSCPDDTQALLGTSDPAAAAAAVRELGATRPR